MLGWNDKMGTINSDPMFLCGESYWGFQHSIWGGSSSKIWGTRDISGGEAYNRIATWGNICTWANSEFGQGRKPWGPIGAPLIPTPLFYGQYVVGRAKYIEDHIDWLFGQANAYVNLWIEFDEPVGVKGYKWAELLIYLKCHGSLFKPSQPLGTFLTRTRTEGDLSWYLVSHRMPSDIGQSYTDIHVLLDEFYLRLQSAFGVDIQHGKVVGITFGVESSRGEMSSRYDYFYLYVP